MTKLQSLCLSLAIAVSMIGVLETGYGQFSTEALAQAPSSEPSGAINPPPLKTTAALDAPAVAEGTADHWLRLAIGIAWPLTIVFCVSLLAFNNRIARMLGLTTKLIRKIKAAGIEMEISSDAADQVRDHLRASLTDLRTNADREYRRMADFWRIYDQLGLVVSTCLPVVLKANGVKTEPANVRATIHVSDIVFRDFLYQLVDYYPSKSNGDGRRFSTRYGIIGRSWRLEESLGEGNAFEKGSDTERVLIEEWGMQRQEVHEHNRKRPAYLSVILRGHDDARFPLGVLFVDSTAVNAFGNDAKAKAIAVALENSSDVRALARSVEKVLAPLRLAGPNIDLKSISR